MGRRTEFVNFPLPDVGRGEKSGTRPGEAIDELEVARDLFGFVSGSILQRKYSGMSDLDIVLDALHAGDLFCYLFRLALLSLFFDFALENYGAVLNGDVDRASLYNLVGGQLLPDGIHQKIVGNGFAGGESRHE